MKPALGLVGVGLIGGSFALALKNAGVVRTVRAIDRDPDALAAACMRGIVDRACADFAALAQDADLIVLAVPVAQTQAVLAQLSPHLGSKTLVMDVGSTKGDVVAAARSVLGVRVGQFVAAHPIAGAETSGPQAARADLFASKKTVLCPMPENRTEDIEKVERLWQACGAQTVRMTVDAHDRMFAAVSHLPHLIAFVFVAGLAGRDDSATLFENVGSGFRDFTRIAASSPVMWRDVALANRTVLLDELDAFDAQLADLRRLIDMQDSAALEALFERARWALTKTAS